MENREFYLEDAPEGYYILENGELLGIQSTKESALVKISQYVERTPQEGSLYIVFYGNEIIF